MQRSVDRRAVLRGGLALGSGALAGPFVFSACSGSDGDGDAAAESAADGKPMRGGTLRIGAPHNPAGFDPYFFRLTDTMVDLNLYTRLVEYDEELVPTPSGAEAWEVANDRLSMVITLRVGQIFHSGKDVTADDLITGVRRAIDPDLGAQLFGASGFIDGVERVDDLRARLTFKQPTAESTLTDWMCRFALIEADRNVPERLQTEPAGSGPFVLREFRPGTRVQLERHNEYFDQGVPYLDAIDATIFDDPTTMANGLQTGELDCAAYITSPSADELKASFQIVPTQTLGTLTDSVGLNPSQPPFDNKPLRQAIARAVNRRRIVDDIAFGYGEPIYLPYLPGSQVYDSSAQSQMEYNLDAARDLWEQAGRPESGEAIAGEGQEALQALQVIQSDLAEIGFKLTIKQLDQQTFTDRLRSGDRGMVFYGSGGNLLNPAAKGANPDLSVTSNPVWGDELPDEFVTAMNDAAGASDEAALAESAARIRDVLLDECWFVGAKSRVQLAATTNEVRDLGYGSPDGHLNLTRTWMRA